MSSNASTPSPTPQPSGQLVPVPTPVPISTSEVPPPNFDPNEQSDPRVAGGVFSQEMTLQVSPYLPPSEYRAYASISPLLAEKILEHNLKSIDRINEDMLANSLARRENQKQITDATIRDREAGRSLQKSGQKYTGMVVIPGGLVLCLIMVCLGYPWCATAFGGSGLVALVGAMLAGKVVQMAPQKPSIPASQSSKTPSPPE